MTRNRKHNTPEEKQASLKGRPVEIGPVSHLCDKLGLNRTEFYSWEKQPFADGTATFQRKGEEKPPHA